MPGTSSRAGGWSAGQGADDGWGPSTAVHGGSSRNGGGNAPGGSELPWQLDPRAPQRPPRSAGGRPHQSDDGWTPGGPAPSAQQRATRAADRRTERSVRELTERGQGRGQVRGQGRGAARAVPVARARERGLPWWAALLVLIVIAVIGGIIDTLGSIDVKGGFNVGIVVASIIAVLVVKRSHMFPIVIAPPIVYSLAAVFQLYLRSDGLDDKKVVLDAAANYLVYGFPAIAVATAAVLIIAGIRLIARK